MKKFSILCDADDCINNLVYHWVDALNTKHKLNVSPNEIVSWDFYKYFPTLTYDEVYEPVYEDIFWKTMTPKKDAIKYLHRLINDGHKVTIVTASYYQTVSTKAEWILNHFGKLKWEDIIICKQKNMVTGDIRIDDGIHNLEGMDGIKILFDMPHNKFYDAEENGMIRVFNWEEIYKFTTKIANR